MLATDLDLSFLVTTVGILMSSIYQIKTDRLPRKRIQLLAIYEIGTCLMISPKVDTVQCKTMCLK
jgi:hypothetical protein